MNEREIFIRALEIDDAGRRREFLAETCRSDPSLHRRVADLLDVHGRTGDFLETPAAQLLQTTFPVTLPEQPGTTVGRYKLLEKIGEGGVGIVFAAEQQEPVRREVALKIIKPGMDTRQVIVRFEAERQVLALMDHPNIATVLDAGATPSGRPYFVMELVRGIPITKYCNREKLGLRRRLELFVLVCHAIQHAHQKGIIHRDIKPSNVLVAHYDGVPVPKVIDFGIAKATDPQVDDPTLNTRSVQLIGTPLYMSPEQAGLGELGVDARSDVYSLGALLYELLLGNTPFDRKRLRQAGFDEMRRIIREEEPLRPSSRLKSQRADCTSGCPHCRGEPRKLIHALRGELDWIVMKALEKDRSRRYDSASALAADVERYLRHEPIEARPASVFFRTRKWMRRHPVFTAVLTVSALCFGGLTVGAIWHNYRLTAALEQSDALRKEAQNSERELRLHLYATDVRQAWQMWDRGDSNGARTILDRHRPRDGEGDRDLRGFDWYYLQACCETETRVLKGHEAPILCAAISPDSRLIASGDRSGAVKIWDYNSGKVLHCLRHGTQDVNSVAFAPDGRLLATAGQDRMIRLWEVATWNELASLKGHTKTICSVVWSPDGRQLASGGRDHSAKIWSVAERREVHALPGHTDVVRAVAWSPDGNLVASAGADGGVRLWNPNTGQPLTAFSGRDRSILALAFSPDGRWLASAGYGTPIVLHDVVQRAERARLEQAGNVWSLAFSADSRLLAAGMNGGRLQLCEVQGRVSELVDLRLAVGQEGALRSVVFTGQDSTLVTAVEESRSLEIRDATSLAGCRARRLDDECLAVDLAHDRAVTATSKGALCLRSFRTGVIQATRREHAGPLLAAAFSPHGDRLVTSGSDGQVILWQSATTRPLHRLEVAETPIHEIAFSPDDAVLAAGGDRGSLFLFDALTGKMKETAPLLAEGRVFAAFSPDGQMIAAGTRGKIVLRRIVDGRTLGVLQSAQSGTYGMAFSPDGRLLAVGGDAFVSLYDVAEQREVAGLMGHRGGVGRVAFAPDGQTLVSLGNDRTTRLWHVPTRRELYTVLRSDEPPRWVEFAAPRRLLVAASPNPQGFSLLNVFDAAPRADRAASQQSQRQTPADKAGESNR